MNSELEKKNKLEIKVIDNLTIGKMTLEDKIVKLEKKLVS